MKKYILPIIILGIILSFASAVYTPPSATNITLILTPPYSAPSYTNITLILTGGNTAPEVQNLNILPASPFTTDDLECSFVTADIDSEKTNATVRWYNNSKLALTKTLNNNYGNGTIIKSNLTSGNTTKRESWLCEVWLYDGQANSTLVNSSVMTIQNTLPTVTLTSPLDNWTVNSTIKFECSASNDISLSNMTLYHNHTGAWQSNGTNTVTGTLTSTSFNRTGFAAEKSFIWNCYSCDSQGACNYSVTNYSLTIDLTKPHINFTNPTSDNNTRKSSTQNWAYVNVSLSDTNNNYSAFIDWNRSLVGWWRFEEDNGTYMNDSSTYGNNGSCSGTTCPVWTTGMRGKAALFDGKNDYVSIPNNLLNLSANFSIELWVKPNDDDENPRWFSLMDTTNNKNVEVGHMSGDEIYFRLAGSTIQTSYKITYGPWYHVVWTYNQNGAVTTIYVDGVAKSTVSGGITADASFSAIGAGYSTTSYTANGTIDEVRIFNRVFSSEEINASYQAGVYRLYRNFTNLNSGNYTYKAYVVDQAGNLNQTETRVLNISYNPLITNITITPNPAYTNDTLNCSGTYSDIDSDKGNITITWYNGSVLYWQVTQFNKFAEEQINEPLTWFNKTGLVGYWKFSEGNGTVAYDTSNNGVIPNNGTLTNFDFNANDGWVDGKYGSGLQFDGLNDYVEIADSDLWFFGSGDLAMSAWIKPNTFSFYTPIIYQGETVGNMNISSLEQTPDKKIRWLIRTDVSVLDITTTSTTPEGQWHHIVAVRNGSSFKIYINAVEGASGTSSTALNNLNYPLFIGGRVNLGSTYRFNGIIDEVMVYNRSLTSAEINASYNNSPQFKNEVWNCTMNATDSQGEAGVPNSTTRTISNLAPSIPEIGGVDNATRTIGNSQTLRCANSSDTDGDTINYVFYGDTTANPTTMLQNSTSTTYTWSTTDGQTYYWRCKAEDGVGGVSGFTAQKTFTENTAPTSVSMVYPADGNSITNRTPQFNWTASTDAEGDTLTYQVNITCYPSCSADNRLPNSSVNQNWTTLTSRLKNFWDDNYYYNWTVRPWDGYEFGTWNSVPYTLKLSSLVSLSMINSSVNFSVLGMGETANTTTNNPVPLSIRNDGNSFANVNISDNTSLLWISQPAASEYFKYRIDNVTGREGSFNWILSTTAWTNVPTSNNTVINYLNYTDATDSAEIEILVTVPPQETAGTKSSRVVFTGFYVREI